MAHCIQKSNGLPARGSGAAVGITHDQVTTITGVSGEGNLAGYLTLAPFEGEGQGEGNTAPRAAPGFLV
jgi:hypothetical protein